MMTTVLTDNGKLRVEYGLQGAVLMVRPVGTLDEDVNFSILVELIKDIGNAITLIQFDLGFVTGLNSCGVREWLLFIERVGPLTGLAFINVNELFIEQANMISNLFGKRGNPILSFQAPYHCTLCNVEATILLDPTQIKFKGVLPVPPPASCPKCSTPMEFDSLEDEYFHFIKRMKDIHVD